MSKVKAPFKSKEPINTKKIVTTRSGATREVDAFRPVPVEKEFDTFNSIIIKFPNGNHFIISYDISKVTARIYNKDSFFGCGDFKTEKEIEAEFKRVYAHFDALYSDEEKNGIMKFNALNVIRNEIGKRDFVCDNDVLLFVYRVLKGVK